MPLARRWVLIATAGTLGLLFLRQFVWPGERPISEYATLEQPLRAGAVARGWIPEGLPASAHSFWEQHDLDTNQVFLRFELPEGDRESMADALRLRKLSPEEIERLHLPVPWERASWFDGLIQQTPANDAALNARVYVSQRADYPAFVAVDSLAETVYVWLTP